MNTPKHVFTRPAWIFFDLDDTIWDFSKNSLLSLSYVYANHKEISDVFPSEKDFIDTYHSHNATLWKLHSQGLISSEKLKSERWRLTLFPSGESDEILRVCRKIDRSYLNYLASLKNATPFAHAVLAALAKEYMIGVISNGFNDTQYRKLTSSGLQKYVTRTIISDEIGIQKPDKQIFEYAVASTGATGIPVMIGDNPDTDVIGALKAGWKAIHFNRTGQPSPITRERLTAEGIDTSLFLGEAKTLKEAAALICN